ncbi:MAG: prolipoprotein diacylglyceryl transferase [Oscillospiraceae bacterium]
MNLDNLEKNQIVFPHLNIDITVDRTAFTIFGVDVQWYGVIISFGLLLAIVFGLSQMKKYGINSDKALDCIIGGIVGGIVGARVYYVAMSWEQYSGNIKSIFNIREGGLAIYGGIIGALLIGLIIAKIKKVAILPLLDIVGMGFLIGQGIGRWGNFFNQEAFGSNTNLPWGMSGGTIQAHILNMIENGNTSLTTKELVHPCFLYESVWCLLGFVVIYVYSKHRKYDGQLFLMYLAWYSFERSIVEGLRTDSLMIGNIRVSQALSVVIFIVSVILLFVCGFKIKRMGEDYVFYKDTEISKLLLQDEKINIKQGEKTSTIEDTKKDENYKSILSEDDENNKDDDNI